MNKFSLIALTCLAFGSLSAQTPSPYINKVYDFSPAPGQFINELPEYEDGDTKDDILTRVNEYLVNDARGLVSLGGFGGNITFGFDHEVVNKPGEYDFKILGNATFDFGSTAGGNSEPGIVMVSYDANKDGIPNDEWYEIAGSEHNNPATIKNYSISFSRPTNDSDPVKWTANDGTSGQIDRNITHKQSYFPKWINDNTLTFTGTKLPNNGKDTSGNGSYWVLSPFEWGYADNIKNDKDGSSIKIEWAVDANGNPANLPGIHFVKIYTGLNQMCGWLGETSTELMGAEDLHVNAGVDNIVSNNTNIYIAGVNDTELTIVNNTTSCNATIYAVSGAQIRNINLVEGVNIININNIPNGVYIFHTPTQSIKFVK